MFKSMKIEARFYETYEMCDIVNQILRDPFSYAQDLEAFHCDGRWVNLTAPFERYSALHKFIEYVVWDVHQEQMAAFPLAENQRIYERFKEIPVALEDMKLTKLPIEIAFDFHKMPHQSFIEYLTQFGKDFRSATEDDITQFLQEAWSSDEYEKLVDQTVKEVFHVVFQDRQLLLFFNAYVSDLVSAGNHDPSEPIPPGRFEANGTLVRARPPSWARRATFFRDRGRCVLCDKDLSGLMNLGNYENYDHIVPLSRFGLNDISNLQLLCAECNQRDKRDGYGATSTLYQTWYMYD